MKEEHFKQLLLEKESDKINEDFDNSMMVILNKHHLSKSEKNKYIRLMYIFFSLGLILGVILSATFENILISWGDYQLTIDKMVFQILIVLLLLLIFERIYKATLVNTGKEKFSAL